MTLESLDRILTDLDNPEVIRLNYSGESGNYPWLIEAIARAKARTGAATELVTSLVSIPEATINKLASSGADRITISLHSLDREKFPIIYGGGALSSFERRMKIFIAAARQETPSPMIDFATVAMQSNVNELSAITSFASQCGASLLSIHPVIRRPGVPSVFHDEADEDGRLTTSFQTALELNIEAARTANPCVRISVARPPNAVNRGGPFTCEQNPFETLHVLANGDVVACEVMDRKPLGNLAYSTLRNIWEGEQYRTLRDRYSRNEIPECTSCIFRTAVSEKGDIRTSWGWYEEDESAALWSRTTSSFECEPKGHRSLTLSGLLPGGAEGNTLTISRDGQQIALVRNGSDQPLPFRVELELDDLQRINRFIATVERSCSPWRRGLSGDTRELGFALFSAALSAKTIPPILQTGEPRAIGSPARTMHRNTVALFLKLLAALQRVAPIQRMVPSPKPVLPDDSLAVIIPERGGGALLVPCLRALQKALAKVSLRTEVIVVVNGSHPGNYSELIEKYAQFRFQCFSRPLGFTAAIRAGLRHVTAGWTYLLNNDVLMNEDTLSVLLPYRMPAAFSLASRISVTSEKGPRETNRTKIEFINGLVNLLELEGGIPEPVEHCYSGGGASLFQTKWLRHFAGRTSCYDPFYWEDAEWGVWARCEGLLNMFIPDSSVQHIGKATIERFYASSEVKRIFERNRLQFQLRCISSGLHSPVVQERLMNAPMQTIHELLQPRRLASMAHTRALLLRS